MSGDLFCNALYKATDSFLKSIKEGESVRIISHLDADGLCASAIIAKTLVHKHIIFRISTVQNIKNIDIQRYINNHEKHILFIDCGSLQIEDIIAHCKNKNVLIFDHHPIEKKDIPGHIIHINPLLHNLNPNTDICTSGMAYFWAKHTNQTLAEQFSQVALMGAIGDMQELNGFHGLNKLILRDAIEHHSVVQEKTPRFFGIQSKPLTKLLAECEFDIPNINRSLPQAERFIQKIGICPTLGDRAIRYMDLTKAEKRLLCHAIEKSREQCIHPKDFYWTTYSHKHQPLGSATRDLRESASLLNACGKLAKPSIGLGLILQDQGCLKLANHISKAYAQHMNKALRWYQANKHDTDAIVTKKNLIILQTQDNIVESMIGPLTAMVANDQTTKKGSMVMCLAHTQEEKTKISLRATPSIASEFDLCALMHSITKKIGNGECGGHAHAAGGLIDRNSQDKFISTTLELLQQKKEKVHTA